MQTKEKLEPSNQIDNNFMLAQSTKQREVIINSDTLCIDQLHSKKQISKDCARAIHFQSRDQDGEIHNVGKCAAQNKTGDTHEAIVNLICDTGWGIVKDPPPSLMGKTK